MLDKTSSSVPLLQADINRAVSAIEAIILGKPEQIRLAVACLLAQGHCLIEDLPGVGKTTLSQAIAHVFGLKFSRIQFTSDLLPADILGVSIFDPNQQIFNFHPGPVFSHFVLADEINRATPKTQSALLEAMEEKQVTVEGITHQLETPFFVIGTQNPLDQSGTFPLPESQLDRFMMKIHLGYPDAKAERALLAGESHRGVMRAMPTAIELNRLIQMQQAASHTHCSDALLRYVQDLIQATRSSGLFVYGLSPRAGLAIVRASKAWALMSGRMYVEPGDVKAVFLSVSRHRLAASGQHSKPVDVMIGELLEQVAIP